MKDQYRKIVYLVIGLSLLVSGWQGLLRIQAESDRNQLQLAVRYTDVIDVARQENKDIGLVLSQLKDKGANAILVRENSLLASNLGDLNNWKAQGKLNSYEGYEVIMHNRDVDKIEDLIKPDLNYILVNDESIYPSIIEELKIKNLGGKEINIGKDKYIEFSGSLNSLSTAGMGFPLKDLQIAADLGYIVLPQAKEWPRETDESIKSFIKKINNLPGKGPIFFADNEVTGATSELMIDFAKENQLGFIEFFSGKQKGLDKLIKRSSNEGKDYKAVKLHTASKGEANKLSTKEIVSRYWLAATERNQEILLFTMPETGDIIEDFEDLESQIEGFADKVNKSKSYQISDRVESYNLPSGSFISAFLSGLGPILVFVLFFLLIGHVKIGVILALLGTIGYAGLLKLMPNLGLQLMALFGASIFPAYAVLKALQKNTKNLKETIVLFLQTSLISFGGAISIIGLLSRTNFGLTLDLFLGVKLAHLIPILLVVGGYVYKKYGLSVGFIKETLNKNITYIVAIGAAGLGLVLLVYTSRTGNTGSVTDLELTIRSGLDSLLGVRPRTKEFLIGYPVLLALLHYGKNEFSVIPIIIGIIGPISLVNTYAHVHTPLLISFIRSGYGLIFGLVFGLILIYIIDKIKKVGDKWKPQKE